MGPSRKMLLTLTGALAFGTMAGLVHGNEGGLRADFGNLSAPWILVAIIPGWFSRSVRRGIAVGTAATLIALVGFYVGLTAGMYGHLGATHGIGSSFSSVLAANRAWFAAGMFSGPVCGGIAGSLGRSLSATWLGVALGCLMVGEIVVVTAVRGRELPIIHMQWTATDLRAYYVEAALGLVVLAAVASRSVRSAR